MYYLIFLFLFALSFNSFSQNAFQYQFKGTYKLKTSDKKPIEYTLRWSEKEGKISGEYSDNFFINTASVKGDQGDLGRNFIVELPAIKDGVKSITFLTSKVKAESTGTTVPISIVTRDRRGNPLTTSKGNTSFVTLYSVAQRQEERPCQEGLGVLGGYCGMYSGLISEVQDRRNRCNLLFADTVKLELQPDAMVVLHIGSADELLNSPVHEVGRVPSNPESPVVDIMSRTCRPLEGVNSSGDTCKELNLRGEFSTVGERKHFKGIYSIKEENTNNLCRYSLSMDIMENQ